MTDETDRFDRLEAELAELKAGRQREAARDASRAAALEELRLPTLKPSQAASERLQRQDAERAERVQAKADDDEAHELALERSRPQREKLAQRISSIEARQASEQARHAQAMEELGAEMPPLRRQLAALELYESPNADEVLQRQTARPPDPPRRRRLAQLAPGAPR